jgi:endonuclease/exonuclease/phosphatase family metal-dependent hydrolase
MHALRVVTINFWGIEPPLERRLDLAEHQLRALAPDAIGMQEVRPLDGKQGRTSADHLAERLGMHVTYGVSLRWADDQLRPGMDGGQEGLAILSRHPILEQRVLQLPEARPTEARILLSARLGTPAGPIWLHTTHLHYRLDDGVARERQVDAIDAAIRGLGREPADPPQILCGDFNATPDSDEMRFLRGLHTLAGRRTHWQDAWLRLHDGAPGITWSSENEQTRPLRSLDLDRRIDYILVTSRKKDGRGTVLRCEVVLTERDDGTCASDHYGVLAEIQIG